MNAVQTRTKGRKRQVRSGTGQRVLADALCALLLAASLECGLSELLGLGNALWQSICACVLALGVLVLFTQKPVLLPAVLALCGMLFALICMFGGYPALARWVGGFVRWWSAAFAAGSGYSGAGYRLLAHFVLALPLCGLLYLYLRRLFYLPPLPVLFVAYLVSIDMHHLASLTAALLLFIAGLAVALSKNVAQQIARRTGEKVSPATLQFPAFFAALLVLVLALLVSPAENGKWWSRNVYNLFRGFGSYVEYYVTGTGVGGSTVMSDFTLATAGYSADTGKLGGDIRLHEGTVMEIQSDCPALLFGAAFDTYTGTGWTDSHVEGSFLTDSAFWNGKRREVFDLDRPLGDRRAQELYEELTRDVVMRIRMRTASSTVFYPKKLIEPARVDGTSFNSQGEVVTESSLHSGASYSLVARVFEQEQADFDGKMNELLARTAEKEDGRFDEVSAVYLQLPEGLPAAVSTFAQALTADCESEYDKALAIERELKSYVYTRSPGDVPQGYDFVEYFLETRQGYCEYFATAMAVLARSAGLPARYCIGYAMEPVSTGRYRATNATAHAWTEIYFSGYGWLAFDPTPGDYLDPEPEDEDTDEPVTPVTGPDPTLPPMQTPPPAPAPSEAAPSGQTDATLGGEVYAILAVVTALLLALVIWLLVRRLGTKHLYAVLARRYSSEGDRLDGAYRRLLRLLGHAGITMHADDTITTFAARADRTLGLEGVSRASEAVIQWRFAGREPAARDVLDLCELVHAISRRFRRERGVLWHITHL